MPIFEYQCRNCGTVFSILVLASGTIPQCSNCASASLRKLMSRANIGASGKSETLDPLRARPADLLQRPERLAQAMKAMEQRVGVSIDAERVDGAMQRLWEAKRKI